MNYSCPRFFLQTSFSKFTFFIKPSTPSSRSLLLKHSLSPFSSSFFSSPTHQNTLFQTSNSSSSLLPRSQTSNRFSSTNDFSKSENQEVQVKNADQSQEGEEVVAESVESIGEDILRTAIEKFVPTVGWSNSALISSIEHLGYAPSLLGLFPKGPLHLVEFFLDEVSIQLQEKMKHVDLHEMSFKERLETVLKTRLQIIFPYRNNWHRGLALLLPANQIQQSISHLANTVDHILELAQDNSAPEDYQLRRTLVSILLVSSELYMLTDYSHEYHDTLQFLNRQIDLIYTLNQSQFQVQFLIETGYQLLSTALSSTLWKQSSTSSTSDSHQEQEPPPSSPSSSSSSGHEAANPSVQTDTITGGWSASQPLTITNNATTTMRD